MGENRISGCVSLMGVRVEERELPGGLCGLYYEPLRLIVLDPRLTDLQRRCTLTHELVHAQYHDSGCGGKGERRARRETAFRLISPVEYATAERVYEADPWQMASALNVTMQVLEDYRMLLHEGMVGHGEYQGV